LTPEFYTFKGDTAHTDIHHNGYTGTYDTITAYCDTCNASTLGGSSTLYILFGDSVRVGSYTITSNIYPSAGQVQLYLNTSSGNPYSSIGTGTITVSLTSAGKKNVIGYGIQMLNATNISDTSVLSLNITP